MRRALVAWWPALLLVVGAIWVVHPMHAVEWWQSHENIWYPVRVHEYLASWDAGIWYPRWCPNLYGGYGYPFLNFYAPGVYAGGAFISKLTGLAPIPALKVLITLVTMAGAVGTYGLLLGETKRTDAALVGGAIYTFLPYRVTDLFARGDLAEYSAYCLIPFVLWAYRALFRASGRRAAIIATAAALAHAAVLMTHTLMGMFTTEMVGLLLVIQLWRDRGSARRPSWVGGAAMFTGIAMSAVYTIPAFFERKLVNLERISGDRFAPWLNMVKLRELDDPFFTPGLAIGIGALVWLASFALPRTRRAAREAAPWWTTSLVLILIMLPWFKWLWHLLPFGAEVQFPWRLLGLIGLFGALGATVWLARLLPVQSARTLALAVVLVAPLPFLLSKQRLTAEERHVPANDTEIRAEFATSTAMDEYLPKTVTQPPPRPRPMNAWADDPEVHALGWQPDGLHLRISIDTPKETLVTAALFAFRGWHVRTLEGPADAKLRLGPGDGLLRVFLPQAGHYEVEVYFGSTPLRGAAAIASLLALIGAFPLLRSLSRRWLTEA